MFQCICFSIHVTLVFGTDWVMISRLGTFRNCGLSCEVTQGMLSLDAEGLEDVFLLRSVRCGFGVMGVPFECVFLGD